MLFRSTFLETEKVLSCQEGTNLLYCAISFSYPTVVTQFIHLQHVTHEGVRIRAKNIHTKFVKDKFSHMVSVVYCNEKVPKGEKFYLCQPDHDNNDCAVGLTHNNIDAILRDCYFEYFTPNSVTVLPDGGILVEDDGISSYLITNGGRPLHKNLPLLLYSFGEVVIQIDQIQLIHPNINSTRGEVINSKLTVTQLASMHETVRWQNFMRKSDFSTILLWLITILQIILIPSLCICCCCSKTCCSCCRKNKQLKRQKMIEKAEQDEIKRQNERLLKHYTAHRSGSRR